MEISAVRVPVAEGSNRTVNVEVPPAAMAFAGCDVTVKSDALIPDTATIGVPPRASVSEPLFWMVKVRVTVPDEIWMAPKSVWSVVDGVASPSAMAAPFP